MKSSLLYIKFKILVVEKNIYIHFDQCITADTVELAVHQYTELAGLFI